MRQREVEYAPALPSTDRHQRGTVGRHQACQMGDVTPAGERFAKWRGKFESARPLRNHRRQGLSKRGSCKIVRPAKAVSGNNPKPIFKQAGNLQESSRMFDSNLPKFACTFYRCAAAKRLTSHTGHRICDLCASRAHRQGMDDADLEQSLDSDATLLELAYTAIAPRKDRCNTRVRTDGAIA